MRRFLYNKFQSTLYGSQKDDGSHYVADNLTAMSSGLDPYRQGTGADEVIGEWFAKALADVRELSKVVHLRGMHYALMSYPGGYSKPNGEAYASTDKDYKWLCDSAGTARWLGYVDFGDLEDMRNSQPEDYTVEDTGLQVGFDARTVSLPRFDELLPTASVTMPVRQRHRLIFMGEKSSLYPLLNPIAKEYDGVLALPTGTVSHKMLYDIVRDIVRDGRPAVVLYFADFDPSGWDMARGAARRIQAMVHILEEEDGASVPQIIVRRVAIRAEHIAKFSLMNTPVSPKNRGLEWAHAWSGLGQTELDALLARSGDFEQVVRDNLKQYIDPTLRRRVEVYLEEAEAILDAEITRRQEAGHAQLEVLRARYDKAAQTMRAIVREVDRLTTELTNNLPQPGAAPKWVRPKVKTTYPPLYDSNDSWLESTLKLVDDKF